MAIQKRKAVLRVSGATPTKRVKVLGTPLKRRVSKKETAEKEDAEDEQQAKQQEEEPEDEEEEEAEAEEEAEEEEEVSEEDRIAKQEEELQAARKKELKGMYIDQLKEVATSKGIEPCKKEDMIEAILSHEAKEREDTRAHQAKLRGVVLSKKQELESLPLPELRDVCNSYGIKGQLSKQARIEHIMKLWQEADGINKGLAKLAANEREQELAALDKAALRALCEKAGVSPFVKDVMVERLVRAEFSSGKFARPTVPSDPFAEEDQPKKSKKDMVDALLETEARRQKDAELKKQKEEAEASKRKELKAMPVDELKKALTQRGQEATGKKDDMVDALYRISVQEEAVAARKAKLRAMAIDDLKKLVTSRGLAAGKKEEMVDAFLDHEAKAIEAVKAYDSKVQEVLSTMKQQWDSKSASELKDMCAAKNLKLGASKEARIDILLEDAKANGGVDKALVAFLRNARTQELLAKEQAEVVQLCERAEVDPLIKDVLVERLLAHEAEHGRVEPDPQPKAKRARKQ